MSDMHQGLHLAVDLFIIVILIIGIWLFRYPRRARAGNFTAAFALACAFVLVLMRHGIVDPWTVVLSLIIGSVAGSAVALSVNMIHIPSMVAFQNGMGGVAACIISYLELSRGGFSMALTIQASGIIGLTIGALTFSGSMIASAKLAARMRQTPQILPGHSGFVYLNFGLLLLFGIAALFVSPSIGIVFVALQIMLALLFGVLFSIRIGGADMPVLISFLNANTGLAAAFCGMVIENQLLIVFGATVAASGSILTYVMCKAMNRPLYRVFIPKEPRRAGETQADDIGTPAAGESVPSREAANQDPAPAAPADGEDSVSRAVRMIRKAQNVIIVPGYGMALARAQQEVAALADEMTAAGKSVRYAIHPVAGRMPGHMNVLLAEAGVDYDYLVEMDEINPSFSTTDLVMIVGACDVVNPSAIDVEGTPITGMPILHAHEAENVICCNLDEKPGYSGVENPLYKKDHVVMLTGDAKNTVEELLRCLAEEEAETPEETVGPAETDPLRKAAGVLSAAGKVVIVPGYGMALSRAQFKVVELATVLEKAGASVVYAIHPVAGRMPGHMNVILAEAEVDYEKLLEMDDVNAMFPETDAVLVFGACDVVNPAAIEKEGTPISGMPILMAREAASTIVCNYDDKPGYSGVENPLYESEKSILLWGDAKETASKLVDALQETA